MIKKKKNSNKPDKLTRADKELSFQIGERKKRAAELIIANKKLVSQNKEKEKRAAALIIANKELIFQNKEKEKKAVELVIANNEIKKTEEALRKSLKEVSDYKYALNESSIVAITDQKGIIKYANENFCKISKYSAKELIGQDHRILNSGYHPKSYIRNLWITIAKGKIWKGEFCNRAKDGSIYWVDATIVPLLNKAGKPYQYLAIRKDITVRKKAERELAEKEYFLRESQRAGNIGSYKTNFLTGYWQSSETLDRIFGIDKNYDRSIAGWVEIVHPDDKQKMEEYLHSEVLGKRKLFNKEYRIKKISNKQTRWVYGKGELKFDDNGNITALIGTIQDITEQKQAEEKLKVSEDKYRSFFNQSADAIFIFDKTGHFLNLNIVSAKLLGYTKTEFIDMTLPDILFKEDLAASPIRLDLLAAGKSLIRQRRFKRKDGSAVEVEIHSKKMPDGYFLSVVRDLTERKKAEELLSHSRQNYKNLLENMNDGFIVDDISGKIIFANKKFLEIFGFTEDDVNDLVIEDCFAPEYHEMLRDRHNRRLAGEKVSDIFEYEGLRKEGKRILLGVRVNPIIENGVITGTQSVIRDITELKRSEIALRESEETFRRLFNESADPVLLLDDAGFSDCNQSAVSILGYASRQDIMLKKPWDISPEKQPDGRLSDEKAEAMIEKALQQGFNRFEWMHIKSDGTEFPVEVMLTPIILKGKQLLYAVLRDITERKKAEEKIRESNERYEFVNKATQDTIWEWDYITNEGHWGEGIIKTFGYSEKEMKYSENWRDKYVHPSDKKEISRRLHACIESGIETWQDEYRFRCADGTYKYVYARGFILYDELSRPYRMIGAMTDVTEKKKLERELADQQIKQHKLITETIIQTQEKERNELGRELHDNINQILATVKMYLGMVKAKENISSDLVGQSYEYVTEAMEEIRKLSHSLVVPSLGEFGLKEALEGLVEDVNLPNNQQVQLLFDEKYNERDIDKNKELMIYRIVQEQLNNVIKYAAAKDVVITMKEDNGSILLSVADNGVGFDPSKKSKGIGLKNIRSRVEFYSGNMNIISAPGQGCTLEVFIPY